MRVLVFGGGVLGSLYAGRLSQAGHDVAILARGPRAEELRAHGIVLEDAATGVQTTSRLTVLEHLDPEAAFDLILVVVRNDQLAAVLPILGAYASSPTLLFMVNNALGPESIIRAVGRERVLLGFAGAGGMRQGHLVRYHVLPAWQQATTLGELDGRRTRRLEQLAAAFGQAGFPVAISPNMDAWLKTHVMWTGPAAHALYMVGGSTDRLAHTRDALVLWVRAVREGYGVLRALGVPVTPPSLRVFELVPEPILVAVLSRLLVTPTADLVIARHANAARAEYLQLGNDILSLARQAGVSMPAFERLRPYVDPVEPTLAAGAARLSLDWGELAPWLGGAGALGALAFLGNRLVMSKR